MLESFARGGLLRVAFSSRRLAVGCLAERESSWPERVFRYLSRSPPGWGLGEWVGQSRLTFDPRGRSCVYTASRWPRWAGRSFGGPNETLPSKPFAVGNEITYEPSSPPTSGAISASRQLTLDHVPPTGRPSRGDEIF